MPNFERQERMQAYLTEHTGASVHHLAKAFYASEATIRRDLTELERRGKIKRTFGGAVPADFLNREVPLTLREQEHMKEKDAIAAQAVKFLHDGDTVFLDASSTVLRMVRYLSGFRDLTVITNGPRTSLNLGAMRISNLCTGGLLLPDSVAYVGIDTCKFFQRFKPDVVFFSCRGVTERGMLSDSSLDESHVREAMLSCGGKTVFLCDTSKLGHAYCRNLLRLEEVDEAICEQGAFPEPYNSFRKRRHESDGHSAGE